MRRRWFMACAGGGGIGFASPTLMSAALPDVTAALPIAGAVAGVVLGGFQAVILRSLLAGFGMRDWVLATAAGTALAWAVVSIFLRNGPWMAYAPTSVQAPLAVAGGLVLVFALGIAQWMVLRRWTERAVLWIVANAVGWTMGLVVIGLITMPLRRSGQIAVPAAVTELVAGLVLAVISAAVTAAFLGYVLEPRYVAAPVNARREGRRVGRPVPRPRGRFRLVLRGTGVATT
ncbi:hypothetical protein [Nocardia nepalensis]|uniref:hypothetical protein n=1 Tax=Nocardia nepalensis TaxID=3375448 RepID=UPI003B66B9F6